MKLNLVTLLLLVLLPVVTHAANLPGMDVFMDEMVQKHQFNREELAQLLQQAQHRPQIIAAISAPSTKKPWLEYRAAFVNPQRIQGGLRFWKKYQKTLLQAEKKYGIPAAIIVAVIGVETLYGQQTGNFRLLDSLTTLAFDYPRRADFFRQELAEFLLLARERDWNVTAIKGSYAGAMGIPQFMPSSYRQYAVDFNHNGKISLRNEAQDAIGSVAHYLQQYGWHSGEPIAQQVSFAPEALVPDIEWQLNADPEVAALLDFTLPDGKEYWFIFNNFRVITRYNHSYFYAMSVFQLAEALRAQR